MLFMQVFFLVSNLVPTPSTEKFVFRNYKKQGAFFCKFCRCLFFQRRSESQRRSKMSPKFFRARCYFFLSAVLQGLRRCHFFSTPLCMQRLRRCMFFLAPLCSSFAAAIVFLAQFSSGFAAVIFFLSAVQIGLSAVTSIFRKSAKKMHLELKRYHRNPPS